MQDIAIIIILRMSGYDIFSVIKLFGLLLIWRFLIFFITWTTTTEQPFTSWIDLQLSYFIFIILIHGNMFYSVSAAQHLVIYCPFNITYICSLASMMKWQMCAAHATDVPIFMPTGEEKDGDEYSENRICHVF